MGSQVESSKPRVAFVLGLTGSGKTTYAFQLARERQVLRFSIDEWMKTLFWMDSPHPSSLEWALERCRRCENQIAALIEQQIALDRGAVLDLGFSKVADRANWKSRCEAMGAQVEIVYLDVPQEERWRRVQARNQAVGKDITSISVDRATFEWMESFFEPLSPEERAWATSIG